MSKRATKRNSLKALLKPQKKDIYKVAGKKR
jgi:hypothetical protein